MPPDNRYTSFNQFNHGSATVAFVEITPRKKEFFKRALRAGWGLCPLEGALRISTGRDTPNKNYRIECGGRAYLVKEGHPASPRLRDLANTFIEFCEKEGAKAPQVRLTSHGWTYYGVRCLLSLYNFIEGEHFSGSRGELLETATRLAQLDKILAKAPFSSRLISESGIRRRHSANNAKSLFEAARSCGARDEFEEEFLSALGYLEEMSASLGAADMERLPFQPIHSNVRPHNLLFSPEGELLAFLDFESLVHSQRAREVAFAMHRLSRAFGEGTERNEDMGADIRDRAKDFLSAYNSENPLEDAEMRSLKSILQDEALSRVLTVLRNHYVKKDSRNDAHFGKRLTMLRETELFDFL